ncbi:MAG TPA: polyamine aminopropyltransferase [Rhodospirillales bacterium]|jgi:spermidine synthase
MRDNSGVGPGRPRQQSIATADPFEEKWDGRPYWTGFQVERMLFDDRTRHQHLTIFDNPVFGRVVALDGFVQTTERDGFIYNEMLAHPAILAHGNVRRVLIIGGGGGGMLREVVKHRSIESIVQVEIDAAVVEMCRKYLPAVCGDAFDDPRATLVIADGLDFVERTDERFDVIIVDSPDPIGPAAVLFNRRFYTACRRRLAAGGVLVTQSGFPFTDGERLGEALALFRSLFADSAYYLAAVPSYPTGSIAFGWASDDSAVRRRPLAVLERRFRAAAIATHHYTPEVHLAAFALPPWFSEAIAADSSET